MTLLGKKISGATVRHLVSTVGSVAVGMGFVSEDQLMLAVGAIGPAVAYVWSVYRKWRD